MTTDTNDLDFYVSAISAGDSQAFARWMAAAELTIRESLRSFAAFVDTQQRDAGQSPTGQAFAASLGPVLIDPVAPEQF